MEQSNRHCVPWFELLAALLCLAAAGNASQTPQVTTHAQWAEAGAGVRLSMEFPPPRSETLEDQQILRIEHEGLLYEVGAPDLPLVNRLVRIPDRAGVSLRILAQHWQPLGTVRVRPLQERLHTEADLPLPWVENAQIYGSDAWWPSQAVSLSDPMILRDRRVVQVSIAPLRWNPVSAELEELASLELSLDFAGENSVNQITAPMPFSPLMENLVGDELISAPDAEGALRDIAWHTAQHPLNYLVFTPANALGNESFQDWLEWKFRKGHRMQVITDDDIAWAKEAIHEAVITEFSGDNPPDYVMLVGDADGGSFMTPTHTGQYDQYYATIAGDDALADLVVGRISARTADHLSTIFNKILAYELSPDLENPDWLHRASFITSSYNCDESMPQLSRGAAIRLAEDHGYTQIDTAFCASSATWVPGWYEAGTSFHNYRGWIGMEGLNTAQILNLAQGPRTPVTVIFSEATGNFVSGSDPCFAEAFLRAGTPITPGGGVAAMGLCTSNIHTHHANLVCGGFWYALLDLDIRQVGTAMFRGKLELFRTLPPGDQAITNYGRWTNLMGDPGMNVWVGEPSVLQIAEAPASISAGDTRVALRIITAENQPVEGAVVCASQPSGMQVLGLTGPDGRVVLTLPALLESDPLWITASHDDCVPVMQNHSLTPANMTPSLEALTWQSGGNAWVLPGSLTSLSLSVLNPLATPMTGATLSLSLAPGIGTISQGTAALPTILSGQSAQLLTPLQFTLDNDVSDDDPVWLDLTLEWDGGAGVTHRVLADTRTPRLELLNPNVSGVVLQPGSTGQLLLEILNSGALDGNDLSLSASFPEESWFFTPSTPVTLSIPAESSSTALSLPITVSDQAFSGSIATLTINWTSPLGVQGQFLVPVRSGAGLVSDPTGPDEYGYYAWEDGDSGPMALDYAWLEIAPMAGGTGTVLDLTDNANQQDDAVMVTLPFAFTLYGESYDEMGVCSNGFVSFGPNSNLETDLRNHLMPGPMGPQPMLAVMWDDHLIPAEGQVCVEYLEDLHIFVVEWYGVRGNSSGGPNTFQLLLLDPAVHQTPSGDAEFIYQYREFRNDQNHSEDFPYCTIGLEDHTGTRGLTLSNYSLWDPTATTINGTRAIRFSTRQQDLSGAMLEVFPGSMNFHMSDTQATVATDSLHLTNTGSGMAAWNTRIILVGDWPPTATDMPPLEVPREAGGPDASGYTWIDSDEPDGPMVHWLAPDEDALPVVFAQHDQVAGPFAMGFDFPFYGQSFSTVFISPDGYLSFSDSTAHPDNEPGLPSAQAPASSICGWWEDLLRDNDLAGHVFRRQSADSLVVSWVEAPSQFGTHGGPFTFQIILESSGLITLQYGDMHDNLLSSRHGTLGLQGPGPEEGFAIRHRLRARNEYAIRITPRFWLEMANYSGMLGPQQSLAIPVTASNTPLGHLMPEGPYAARILLTSAEQTFHVPVNLFVGDVTVSPEPVLPASFSLGQVWPNPFNPTTTVEIRVPDTRPFRLRLFNLQGQLVRTLLNGSQTPGTLQLTLDASDLASGVYLLNLEGDGFSDARKIVLLR
ncbi:MAG: T9SS type A sorting domain-containing protein [Candidatus Delongbacteria bacterium]|nr:T9SS type A sorting domain-containing protein [Candidatus Delongbacteria bacterium]